MHQNRDTGKEILIVLAKRVRDIRRLKRQLSRAGVPSNSLLLNVSRFELDQWNLYQKIKKIYLDLPKEKEA